ncbi:energy transducer TonB [Sphingomonas sp. 2R-10]|uniref:energy transducer TonB n=1 Tax=Sphingomonas sp. 2R-10 TaxID=3045148 RepID=UPI000F7A96C8|nr:energy transducer TonB [Sphingomonas sp. 2R-10]MDJ0275804.1 energy transducer TonB [Sphingomonas sp. 2R-10]
MRTMMLAALVAGQSGDVPPLQPAAPWGVDYADSLCTLSRTYGDAATPITLAFQPDFFGQGLKAFAMGTRRQLGGQGAANVTLAIPGRDQPIRTTGTRFHLPTGDRAVLQYILSRDVFESLVDAPTATIDTSNGPPVTVVLSLSRPAVAALRRCETDLLAKSGYDPAKVARVVTPPGSNPGSWLTDRDYPEAARKAKQSGKVFVGMTVAADGKVTDCRILQSSGAASLDQATCPILFERARFRPGLDADGKPVESYKSLTFTWSLPR